MIRETEIVPLRPLAGRGLGEGGCLSSENPVNPEKSCEFGCAAPGQDEAPHCFLYAPLARIPCARLPPLLAERFSHSSAVGRLLSTPSPFR